MAETRPSKQQVRQLHFVLVHGACHGGWCWYKIRTLLEASGHKVTCLDLKCSGIDPTDFNTVFTFDEYNEPLIKFMASLSPGQKVILVGHSAGGLSITDAMHKFAEKVDLAIYIAAVMLKHGDGASKDQDTKDGVNDYEYIYGLGPDQPPTGVRVKPERQRTVLYNMSPIEDYVLASMLLRPAPARALEVAWVDNGAGAGAGAGAESVPRVFVRTLHDQLMAQEEQDYMIEKWPPSQVFATQSDHSPFFSTPDALFRILIEVAAPFTCDKL